MAVLLYEGIRKSCTGKDERRHLEQDTDNQTIKPHKKYKQKRLMDICQQFNILALWYVTLGSLVGRFLQNIHNYIPNYLAYIPNTVILIFTNTNH
jgi:hypothetical protein